MDLTRAVLYGRERIFDFNSAEIAEDGTSILSGVVIKRVDYGDLEVVGYTEKRSQDDGNDGSDVYLGRRRVTLVGEVYGRTKGELFDRLREMRYAINARLAYQEDPGNRGYLPLTFYEPTEELATFDSGVIRLMLLCRSMGGVSTAFDRDKQGGDDGAPLTAPFTVTFEAIDPRVYLADREDVTLEGASGTLTLVNRGGHPAVVNMILAVEPDDTLTQTFTITIGGVVTTITIPTGTETMVLRVDGMKKVVTIQQDDVERLAMSTRSLDSEWPTLPRGETAATWSIVKSDDSDGDLLSVSKLWYRETFS